MTTIAITLHVLAAIVLIGPVMVATSLFPAQLEAAAKNPQSRGGAHFAQQICATYGLFSALVPVLGIAVFLSDISTYATMGQFHAAILLSVIAWALLLIMIVPRQKKALAALDEPGADITKDRKQLAMFAGIFNLLWFICAVLMFI